MKLFRKNVIGPENNPYLTRYIVVRFDSWGIYLHKLWRSDYERALHDHPWPFVSLLIRRGYSEVTEQGTKFHPVGSVLRRPAEWRHRVIIHGKPAWSLVFVGRRIRKWGFWLNGAWCWWRKYNYALAICEDEILWRGGKD